MFSFSVIAALCVVLSILSGSVNSVPICRGVCGGGSGPAPVCPPFAVCARGTGWVISCIAPHKLSGTPYTAGMVTSPTAKCT